MGDVIEGAFPKKEKTEPIKQPEFHTMYEMAAPATIAELDMRVLLSLLMDKGIFTKDEFVKRMNELWY